MHSWIVTALFFTALTFSLLTLVRQVRLVRALRRLIVRLINLGRNRHA
jgi:hypothetical protein